MGALIFSQTKTRDFTLVQMAKWFLFFSASSEMVVLVQNQRVLESSREFWRIQKCFRVIGRVLNSFGEFWRVLESFGEFHRASTSFGGF